MTTRNSCASITLQDGEHFQRGSHRCGFVGSSWWSIWCGFPGLHNIQLDTRLHDHLWIGMFNVQCYGVFCRSNLLQSQEYDLGSYLRQTYLDPVSPSYIQGIQTDFVDIDQLHVRADAGGGNMILDSAYALLQGLYPPTTNCNSTLANGQAVGKLPL
jgi:hypothetical protein